MGLASATGPVPFRRADVEQSIGARFATQVARHGARTAVHAADGTLTYVALDAAANQTARAVLDRTGGAAGRVAMLVGNGVWAPVAVLGALKAGGVFVPLHVRHPVQRNALVLSDAGARVLVADPANAEQAHAVAAMADVDVIVLDADTAGQASGEVGVDVDPHDPCCIFYTSGSTGRPKGVVHAHRNVLFGCWNYTSFAGVGCDDRLSLLHALTAIGGSTALMAALMNGGAICPLDPVQVGLAELAAWVDRAEITTLHVVPTVFRHLTRQLGPGRRFERVRLMRLGGEAVTLDEWAAFRAHFARDAAFLGGLGSTECGNYRQSLLAWDDAPVGPVLPVGDAVPERETVLCDSAGAPVPPGQVGEIVVRSEFIFSEYWRQPELTARTLAVESDGMRRFRTGDLARYDERGALRHAGRVDYQVKVAGNRVETAEIEHALRGVPSVLDAAVVPRVRGGDTTLVAFVATGGDALPPPTDVRAALRARLPAHMMPAAVVALDALPLLSEGKIDRRTLADRAAGGGRAHRAPRNPVEETLAAIWQRVLDVDGIGIDDDFLLDLGGDSLAAVRVLAEVASVFGHELPLDVFLEATTVAALAERLGRDGWAPPPSGRLVLHADGHRPPLFAVCGVFGHALRILLLGRALGPSQPLHALQPPGMDWAATGCATIEAMAACYVAEVRRVQPVGPYRLVGTSLGGVLVFEMAVQLQRAGADVALLAMVDTQPPDCEAPHGLDRRPRGDWFAGIDESDRLVAMGVRVARAHRAALDAYVLRRRFDGRIVYFRCRDEPVPASGDRRPLWTHFATDGVRVVTVPGRHGGFHREPQCSAVADGLRDALRDAGA
jgi:amino acid adenylation domain-containing protein